MYVVNPLDFVTVIKGIPVAIRFERQYMQLDPKTGDQWVSTCYLRQLMGSKKTLVGVAVCHPNDKIDEAYGHKLALFRAIESVWPIRADWTRKQAWHLARRVIWEWQQEQKSREMLAAVQGELERLEQANGNGNKAAKLPEGPVSQFIGAGK